MGKADSDVTAHTAYAPMQLVSSIRKAMSGPATALDSCPNCGRLINSINGYKNVDMRLGLYVAISDMLDNISEKGNVPKPPNVINSLLSQLNGLFGNSQIRTRFDGLASKMEEHGREPADILSAAYFIAWDPFPITGLVHSPKAVGATEFRMLDYGVQALEDGINTMDWALDNYPKCESFFGRAGITIPKTRIYASRYVSEDSDILGKYVGGSGIMYLRSGVRSTNILVHEFAHAVQVYGSLSFKRIYNESSAIAKSVKSRAGANSQNRFFTTVAAEGGAEFSAAAYETENLRLPAAAREAILSKLHKRTDLYFDEQYRRIRREDRRGHFEDAAHKLYTVLGKASAECTPESVHAVLSNFILESCKSKWDIYAYGLVLSSFVFVHNKYDVKKTMRALVNLDTLDNLLVEMSGSVHSGSLELPMVLAGAPLPRRKS